MNRFLAVTIGVLIFIVHAADASTVQLPKTGQNTCYTVSGSPISCGGTGQDGDWKAGITVGQRFTVGTGLQAACVTDNLTGLMWMQSPVGTALAWQATLDYVQNTVNASGGLCGFPDWRVPAVVELESMVHVEVSDSAAFLNTQGFSGIQSGNYWSSSTNASNLLWAWYVTMSEGLVYNSGAKTAAGINNVWPVRSSNPVAPAVTWESGQKTCSDSGVVGVIPCAGTGQDADLTPGVPWPNPRFANNGNGTVTDNLTGLIWLKNANCFGQQAWDIALVSSNTLKGDNTQCSLNDGSLAGDWRLPNRKELFSLVDFEFFGPAISNTSGTGKGVAGDPFDNFQSAYYWSSTTHTGFKNYAWAVGMDGGIVDKYFKPLGRYIWPVRGGQVDKLTLLTPKGGEEVLNLGIAEIRWAYQGSNIQLLNIELWQGGVFLTTLAASVPVAGGTYLWNIPLLTAGVDYQIRLVDAADSSLFTIGLPFTVSVCNRDNAAIGGITYITVQDAYDVAVTNDVIQARAVDFPGLVCDAVNNPNVTYVTISGGFNCAFSSQIGVTYIDGPVIISAGSVEIKSIAIK